MAEFTLLFILNQQNNPALLNDRRMDEPTDGPTFSKLRIYPSSYLPLPSLLYRSSSSLSPSSSSPLLPTDKRWWRVDFVLNERLSSILLFGSLTRNGERHVIIPVATETKLTIRNLRHYLAEGASALDDFCNEQVN